ncbi:autotransporter domain-containing protein [Mannheimia haemolytica]|uniref:autotransporter domain-containing protein n=1 Tax=Mannheimia haemolytica TaxID=75985 RepID=UPI0025A15E5E|nr:S6 family peptidase [Mannheimia haemolytica]HDL1183251.1 autotransporter domain-containing protein [Mannheimia haemolytica]HDL1204278.1 autotransporter domain-containing protein [Mannheimia haemolytica]HDL1213107.1 autotransporter domain-containing protein [Mannheimia haemolytica]
MVQAVSFSHFFAIHYFYFFLHKTKGQCTAKPLFSILLFHLFPKNSAKFLLFFYFLVLMVLYSNEVANGKLLITGGTNLNGTLSAEGTSEIILSGRPTPHAYDKVANKEVLIEGDWINRSFNATIFAAKDNGKLEISRNVANINGNFNLTDNATAQIGFTQGTSQACIRSDRTGVATCNINATLSETDLNSWERTKVAGNVSLADNSTFSLGSKADLTGSITAQESTKVQLNDGSIANLTGLSTTGIFNGANGSTVNLSGVWTTLTNTVVDVLNVANGSQIHLNTPTATKQNTLTANTLTGNGIFKFVADLTKTASDIVTIKDTASGQFSIEISTNGSAHSAQKIKLFETTNEEDFSLNLANEVRSGEYRYHLLKEGNVYYLNPEKEEEPKITQKGPSETADPLPEYTGDIEHSEKGPGETADPLPEYTGDIEHSEKGSGETAEPLPKYNGNAHLIASELTAQTNAVLGVTTVLDHVIHSEGTQNWKVWSKTDYQTTEHRSAGYGFNQDANVIHLGLEKALDNQVTLGMILSQSKARNNFDHYYSGKGRLTMLSMYAKKTWQNGVFVAIDTGFGKASNRLTYQANTVKLDRSVFVTGLSIGKAWESANVNIIPSFSARYHHLSSAGNQLVDAKIETNAVDLLALQAGLSINKTLELNGLQIKPEIGSYFVDASHGKLRTRFNNLQIEQQMGRYFKQEAGISANYRNINAGIQAGFLTGNTLNKQRYISFKVTYEW